MKACASMLGIIAQCLHSSLLLFNCRWKCGQHLLKEGHMLFNVSLEPLISIEENDLLTMSLV